MWSIYALWRHRWSAHGLEVDLQQDAAAASPVFARVKTVMERSLNRLSLGRPALSTDLRSDGGGVTRRRPDQQQQQQSATADD